jgi:hypothetical protein
MRVPTAFERARRFSQLAQECDHLAQIQTDPALKDHYENIAIHYFSLAEIELRLAQERQERVRERKRHLAMAPEQAPDLLPKTPAPSVRRPRKHRRTAGRKK